MIKLSSTIVVKRLFFQLQCTYVVQLFWTEYKMLLLLYVHIMSRRKNTADVSFKKAVVFPKRMQAKWFT